METNVVSVFVPEALEPQDPVEHDQDQEVFNKERSFLSTLHCSEKLYGIPELTVDETHKLAKARFIRVNFIR